MLPDMPGSADWTDYVAQCVKVSGGVIRTGPGDFAGELYRCTFGIKRLAVQLLKQAYLECRNDGRHCVELRDLGQAYRSAAYTSSASEVEYLQSEVLGNRRSKLRLDLKCPFEIPAAFKANIVDFANAERDQRVIAKVFDSSLSDSERSAKKEFEDSVEAIVAKRPRKPPVEKLSKEEQANAFYAYLDIASRSSKPKQRS